MIQIGQALAKRIKTTFGNNRSIYRVVLIEENPIWEDITGYSDLIPDSHGLVFIEADNPYDSGWYRHQEVHKP